MGTSFRFLLLLSIANAIVTHAFIPGQHYYNEIKQYRRQPMMIERVNNCITITVSSTSGGADIYSLRATLFGSMDPAKSWTVSRSYNEIDEWQSRVNKKLGYIFPPIPPRDLLRTNSLQLEDYLNKIIQLQKLWDDLPSELDFFAIPSDVREDLLTPTLKVDVFDVDGRALTGEAVEEKAVKTGSTIAGAIAGGFLLGGPLGMVLGASVANLASGREDTLGDVVRTGGKLTNFGLKKLQELDNKYDISKRGTDLIKSGFDKVKRVIDTLDSEE